MRSTECPLLVASNTDSRCMYRWGLVCVCVLSVEKIGILLLVELLCIVCTVGWLQSTRLKMPFMTFTIYIYIVIVDVFSIAVMPCLFALSVVLVFCSRCMWKQLCCQCFCLFGVFAGLFPTVATLTVSLIIWKSVHVTSCTDKCGLILSTNITWSLEMIPVLSCLGCHFFSPDPKLFPQLTSVTALTGLILFLWLGNRRTSM